MKSRLARKIAKIVFAYQNWDSNYQPYSVGKTGSYCPLKSKLKNPPSAN